MGEKMTINNMLSDFFNLGNLISFGIGIISGIIIIILIILIIISKEKKHIKKEIKKTDTIEDLSESEIKSLIKNKQNDFVYLTENSDIEATKAVIKLSLELIHEISSYYYPDSKYPEYEITIDEAIILIDNIEKKLDKLFKKPILKSLRKTKISAIVDKTSKAKNAYDVYNDSGAKEVYQMSKPIASSFDPVYWTKKIFLNAPLHALTKKASKEAIKIVGIEARDIYSKKFLSQTETLEFDESED